MSLLDNRRSFLALATAGVALVACHDEDEGEDVAAVEDLMREHGVIRRVLVVYRESAARLRSSPTSVPPDALQKAAQLMQNFGEDYHEKALEEAHLFPAVKKAGGAAAGLIDALLAQHQRGREITGYVLSASRQVIGAADAEPLARALEGFARMYEEHAAQEDTVVFQAWKKSMSKKQLDEMGDMFEDIEHKTFGKDGFDDAREKIAAIEASLGITLAGMLAPAPLAIR
jgi:hemerythrin-like domain-containing protein